VATEPEVLEDAGETSQDEAVRMALGIRDNGAPAGEDNVLIRLEHRSDALEQAFADLVQRHEQKMLSLRTRMDRSERHHIGAMLELRAELGQTAMRLKGFENMKTDSTDHAEPSPEQHQAAAPFAALPESNSELTPTREFPLDDSPQQRISTATESYLAVARRAAIAAAAQKDGHNTVHAEKPKRASGARLAIIGCIAPVIILGAASVLLNRHTVAAKPSPVPPAHTAAIIPAQAPLAQPLQTPLAPTVQAPVTAAQTVLTSPGDPTPAELALSISLAELQQKANSGEAQAERQLGLKYLAGNGVVADDAEAARWLMSAAYKGEPTAQYWLGTLYARGRGVPADASQANHWYEAAAKQGDPRAMHNLTLAHLQGPGTDKNPSEAGH